MTGLFFGSFNPIHIGHLALANYLLAFTELKEIWFVVSPHNPLKDKKTLLDYRQRLHMVNLAIEGHQGFKASDIEFKLPQPSYTINTLVHLEEKYPQKQFALIMGTDSIGSIHKWKNAEQVLQYPIFIYPREGYNVPPDLSQNKNIHLTEAPIIEISSTMIRQGIKDKKDLSYFMHPKVAAYIQEMGFYKKIKVES